LLEEVERIAKDIESMRIRGAGRIARAAASALAVVATKSTATDRDGYVEEMVLAAKRLIDTRPTAVSLPNSVRFVMKKLREGVKAGYSLGKLKIHVIEATDTFIENSEQAVVRIGEYGSKMIDSGDTVMTHCNSAAALEIIKTAHKQGKDIRAFATETRPLFQGHITSQILSKEGIDVSLICDNAVRYFISRIDKVVVGADAIAANGALINKIGTSMVALAAKEASIPFIVGAETIKFSPETIIGELIKIEERPWTEVISREMVSNIGKIKVYNPAFDITPQMYIDMIVTEKGVIPPQGAIEILQEDYGWMTSEELYML
jgi:ribose 1,5-bisphosphate isomerase